MSAGPATGNSSSGSGGGAGVGNAAIDPSNPTWTQSWLREAAPFVANANPTPTQLRVEKPEREFSTKKVQGRQSM
jgi:hypothetical protein